MMNFVLFVRCSYNLKKGITGINVDVDSGHNKYESVPLLSISFYSCCWW